MASTTSSVAEALRATLDLFDTGLDLMRQNLRRGHPESGDAEIERLLRDWLLIGQERNLVTVKAGPSM